MRSKLLRIAMIGLAVAVVVYLPTKQVSSVARRVKAEVLGLADPIEPGGHTPFVVRVHNSCPDAIEIMSIAGIGCKLTGCIDRHKDSNPIGTSIPSRGTHDIQLVAALRGSDPLTTTLYIHLRTPAGLITKPVEVAVKPVD